ncbi:hypothetical protein DFH07DRAFT_781111 [Mycena maculata]|uniref:Uncharacterized protein n=1 Tax=Mycena maculata TaxID=230809 RepID=A0AAD7HZP5_9AGAR|nr:hypothetical protein DFH07DRAFT_781111 [Mycena maculata]
MRNAEVQNLLEGAQDFGFHEGIGTFSADVVPKIDIAGTKDRIHLVCVSLVLAEISAQQFGEKIESTIDKLAALPVVQRNTLKFTMWVQNNIIEEHIRALALPVPQLMVVLRVETENWRQLMEPLDGNYVVLRILYISMNHEKDCPDSNLVSNPVLTKA